MVVAGGALARLLAARGDLWLDEIWSMEMGRAVGTVAGVLSGLHNDNNHHLNTLWLLLLGPDSPPLALRSLSVAAGVAAVVVAARGDPRARDRSLSWAFLLAFSYVLVHYGSEARGYGPALFLAVACFVAMGRLLDTGGAGRAIGFAVAATLGLLFHLTFLYALLGFLAWGLAAAIRTPERRELRTWLAVAFGPPLLAFAALWAIDLRFLVVGGGPPYDVGRVLVELGRTTFGLPRGAPGWTLLPVCLVPVAGFAVLARTREARSVFFLVAIVVAPALVLVATRPEYLAPRYFVVAVPFVLWLTAAGGLRLARSGRAGAAASIALALLFLAGNGAYLLRLLRDGRGQYRDALAFVLRSDRGPLVTVSSDHDVRNATVIEWHLGGLPGAGRLRYVRSDAVLATPPTWVLVHHFEDDPLPGPAIEGPGGVRYDLLRVFPHAGLSGWDWYVYRRATGQGAR